MLGLLLHLALQADDAIARGGRPPVASPWREIVSAHCEGTEIAISRAPGGGEPTILMNGEGVHGPAVGELVTYLGRRGAVYRTVVTCLEDHVVHVEILMAERQDGRPTNERPTLGVKYHKAHAQLKDGRLAFYTGMREIDEEAFWFQ